MSFCQYCGEKNPDTSKFCFRCGKPLGTFVPANQPPVPVQNNEPVVDPDATQRVQMPFNEPAFDQPAPEQISTPFDEPAPAQVNVPYNEPSFSQPVPEQVNVPYNEPAFEQPVPEQVNVPYNESAYGQANVPYNEPAFQQYNQGQMNVPYNEPSFQPPQPQKKKKNKTPIIAVCAILVIIIAAAAALIFTHTICLFHEYSEPTCTKAAVCTYCDKEGDGALGHKWADATCTEAKKCETCGETEGEALGHTWNEATCTVAKTCSVCNEVDGEALGHNYTGGSCTEASMCSRCNEMGTEAPGHTESDWVAEKEATLSAGGYEVKRCEVCDTLLDSRNTSKKEPQVKSDSFNFGHYEFAEWIDDEISDIEVDYNYELDGSYVYYEIRTDDYDEGFIMLEVNSAGEVNKIVCWFEDETLAAAFCILTATGIDPNFAKTDAVQEFNNGGDSFTDAGMSVGYLTTDSGYKYAALIPSSASSNNA